MMFCALTFSNKSLIEETAKYLFINTFHEDVLYC